MGRKNNKKQLINYENSIKKSNELSIAKMNQGLTLNQMQLFAYAIFSTQQDGKTEFRKHEFEKKFSISQLRPDDAMDDAYRLLDLKIHMRDAEQERGRGHNVFTDYYYDKGLFSFNWNQEFVPHILELKEKYIVTDLAVTSKFKSGFSWILYDYLKAHYAHWYKELTKNKLMQLFNVEGVKSYEINTSVFKNKVLDVAIRELNDFTEYEVWYSDIRKGRSIIGFTLHWSTGKKVSVATDKQMKLLKKISDEVDKNMFNYMSIKNIEQARHSIIAIKDIQNKAEKGLSSEQAKECIKESLYNYDLLQDLLVADGIQKKKRNTSVYFNWLDETE